MRPAVLALRVLSFLGIGGLILGLGGHTPCPASSLFLKP